MTSTNGMVPLDQVSHWVEQCEHAEAHIAEAERKLAYWQERADYARTKILSVMEASRGKYGMVDGKVRIRVYRGTRSEIDTRKLKREAPDVAKLYKVTERVTRMELAEDE